MRLSVPAIVLLSALATGGCGGFFIGLGLLIDCGIMPMSWDSCRSYSKRKPWPQPTGPLRAPTPAMQTA